MVRLLGGAEIALRDVRAGDVVQALAADGRIVYSPVYLDMHPGANAVPATFVVLRTASNHTLRVTPAHFVATAGARCGGASATVRARDVRVGDRLIVSSSGGAPYCSPVVAVTAAPGVGISSPYTLEGSIFVDGVAASVYADAELGASSNHAITAPARALWAAGRAALPAGSWLGAVVDAAAFELVFLPMTLANALRTGGPAACVAVALGGALRAASRK